MKIKLIIVLIFLGIVKVYSQQIEIKVTNISKIPAQLILEFYDNDEDFLKSPVIKKIYNTNSSVAILKVNDIPPGNYAVGVILDENKNGKLDTNFLGFPTEPIGLSNYSEIRGKPKFSKSLIKMKKVNNSTIIIPLN